MSKSVEKTAKDLPISVHEYMLGVDICIHSRQMFCEINDIYTGSKLSPDPEIRAVDGSRMDLAPGSRERKYLAAWARRNLFSTESDHDE